MATSKAFATGKIIDTGAPAIIDLRDEGITSAALIKSLNFVGAAVVAASDVLGNVTVTVADAPPPAAIFDGGNF